MRRLHWRLHVNRSFDALLELLLAMAAAWGVVVLLLSFFRMMWRLYCMTQVGQRMVSRGLEIAAGFEHIASRNPFFMALEVISVAAFFCIVAATAARFLHFADRLFHSKDFVGKGIWWGTPLCLLSATALCENIPEISFQDAAVMAGVPVLCLLNPSFSAAGTLVPEAGRLLTGAKSAAVKAIGSIRERF